MRWPNFPLVLANVLSVKDRKPLFKPYVVLDRSLKVTTADGKGRPMRRSRWVSSRSRRRRSSDWDKRWLNGVVYTDGIKELAEQYIRDEGAGR